ncbi:MFS general substrate transporter, partial [Aaosphaeria arxii CBS 175.79]
LWLSLFMSAMDTTIITTALIKISSEFNALSQAAWLVTTYLLTYNCKSSALSLLAKFSDVIGLKTTIIACNVLFIAFSMGCGVNGIILRACQGIGGSGMYSLVFVAIMKLITPEKMGFYSGVISSVFAIANLLGPLLGGLIVDRTTWRWIFWINGPIVAVAGGLLFISMPGLKDGKSYRERLRGFDILGAILSVCWPIPLLFALQEGGTRYGWDSGVIIGTLTSGLILLLLFGGYEAWITYRTHKDPVFPFRFLRNPACALLLLSMLLLGMPFLVVIIQLPQRFQAVNFISAERAGINLLPVTMISPVGAMIAGVVMGKKIAAEYILVMASVITCLGVGLLSSLPVTAPFPSVTYGFEIITGLGLGIASPPYFFLLYTSVEDKDMSTGTGALNMFRTLGGCIAVAISTAMHNSVLEAKLPSILDPEQITIVKESAASIRRLPPHLQKSIGEVFGESYNRQFQVMLAFCGLNILVTLALVFVRKRMGIFGKVPVRKEENEFYKKPDNPTEEGKEVKG